MPKMHELNIGVAIITSLFHPYYGGAEKQLGRLAEALLFRGVKCYILTRRLDDLKPFEFFHNVPVYRVFSTPRSSRLLSALTFTVSACSFFIAHPNITRRVGVLQADSDSPGLIAVIVGKLFKKKVVIRMRGARQLAAIKGSLFIRIIFRIISGLSHAIVVQYNQVDDLRLLGIDDSKIHLIPNGVDTEYFTKSAVKTREHFREEMAFKDNVIGLYVGRLDPIKGLDLLLEALPSVTISFPHFRLIITGSGLSKGYIEDRARSLGIYEKILFTGDVENVKTCYEIADIFILPSKSEGISNALLEAMSMELAVIATAVGGTPEVVEDMRNGCLISPSSKEILDKLNLLIKDRHLRNRLGKAARSAVVTNFSIEKTAEKYLQLYACMR